MKSSLTNKSKQIIKISTYLAIIGILLFAYSLFESISLWISSIPHFIAEMIQPTPGLISGRFAVFVSWIIVSVFSGGFIALYVFWGFIIKYALEAENSQKVTKRRLDFFNLNTIITVIAIFQFAITTVEKAFYHIK